MRALIVDDSATMRSILKMSLRKWKFEIKEAKDGLEALAVLESSGPVDLMLVDWNMPEMNGYDLVSRIRQNPAHAAAKIMMVTTETSMGEMSKVLSIGANEYLMKPFTPDVIASKLEVLGFHLS